MRSREKEPDPGTQLTKQNKTKQKRRKQILNANKLAKQDFFFLAIFEKRVGV